MKITNEHYQYIENEFDKFIKANTIEMVKVYKQQLLNDKRVKDINMRLRWDIYNNIIPLDFTCDTLYKYLHDTHIDSALKKIMKKYNI